MAPSLKDFYLKSFQLPNGGGTFQSPAPIVQGTENPMPQATWGNGAPVYQNPLQTGGGVTPAKPIFSAPSTTANPIPTPTPAPAARSKYINPETGKYFTPQEYANYVALRIPASKGAGDIPQYAGDAMTKPDESTTALTARATNLNNTRNDIATGTTDPYKAGAKSGIAYSPQELNAIEKAYAGVYDPALNDVFARLKEREAEEKKKADREEQIFQTNENIRQWKATTGSKTTSDKSIFTDTDIKNGVKNSGLTFDEFNAIEDAEVINFFSRPPVYKDEFGKSVSYPAVLRNLVRLLKEGDEDTTVDDVTTFILDQDLPESVKQYYIDQLPIPEEKKEKASMSIWGLLRATGAIGIGAPGLFGPKL
jgi:hypothetical protein